MSGASAESSEIWSLIKETQKNIKDLAASQKETDRDLKELAASQKETARQLQKTDRRFNSQWGKLVESLVEGKLVEMLNNQGIEVSQTSQRTEVSYKKENGDIQKKEFDILAINGNEVVAVEVKTVLTPDKVNYFLSAMKDFKKYFSQYKSHTVYGAVAYLRSDSEASMFSERQGLFVIRATGDSARIINKKNFRPKAFS